MAREKKKKRIAERFASVFYVDQIEALDKIAEDHGVSRAALLREGAEIIIKKYTGFKDEQ